MMGAKIEPQVTYVTHIMTCAKKKNLTQVKEGGGGGQVFLVFLIFPTCSHHVLNEFSTSQRVPKFPNCFQMHSPQDIPNSTWVLSHMVCPKLNSPLYKQKKRKTQGGCTQGLFLFCN